MKRGLETILISAICSVVGLIVIVSQFSPNQATWHIKGLFWILASLSFVSILTIVIFLIQKAFRIDHQGREIIVSLRRSFIIFIFFGLLRGLHTFNYSPYITIPILILGCIMLEYLFVRRERKTEAINEFS